MRLKMENGNTRFGCEHSSLSGRIDAFARKVGLIAYDVLSLIEWHNGMNDSNLICHYLNLSYVESPEYWN